MKVTVTIQEGTETSTSEFDLMPVMQAELRLIVQAYCQGFHRPKQPEDLADVFGRLCTLGVDQALALYGKSRLKAVSREFVDVLRLEG